MQTLSLSEARVLAPQAFATSPAPTVSDKYSFLPTTRIIEDMQTLGWSLCGAKASKSRGKNPIRAEFGMHIVEFFHPNITIKSGDDTEAYIKVVIMNNAMGVGKIRVEVGVFRLVCENGLVIKDADFGSFRLKHRGYSFEDLQGMINGIVEQLPVAVNKINMFNTVELTKDQQESFATEAIKIRMGNGKVVTVDEIEQVLQATRPEDEGDTLWCVLNRVQESLIRGGVAFTNERGKTRKSKPLKNFAQDMQVNQDLWELANQYVDYAEYEVVE
jgi:hypothetical protein